MNGDGGGGGCVSCVLTQLEEEESLLSSFEPTR